MDASEGARVGGTQAGKGPRTSEETVFLHGIVRKKNRPFPARKKLALSSAETTGARLGYFAKFGGRKLRTWACNSCKSANGKSFGVGKMSVWSYCGGWQLWRCFPLLRKLQVGVDFYSWRSEYSTASMSLFFCGVVFSFPRLQYKNPSTCSIFSVCLC